MYMGVSDKARKITIGFGKMEAIGVFVKNSFRGVMDWGGVRMERVGGRGEWEVRKLAVACVDNFWAKLDRERGAEK